MTARAAPSASVFNFSKPISDGALVDDARVLRTSAKEPDIVKGLDDPVYADVCGHAAITKATRTTVNEH